MIWTQDQWGWWRVTSDAGSSWSCSVCERGTACTCHPFNLAPFRESDCAHLQEWRERHGTKPLVLVPGSVAATAATQAVLARMQEVTTR